MNYLKKMCVLRQIKQGFSGDGKTLSGLVKVEQYGKNIAVEVSVINFAPLVSGEYYCLISDVKGRTEMLPLRGKSLFNILSDIDITEGFCGVICFVKNEIVPIAYGVNGDGAYDWKKILNATLPPSFAKKEQFGGGAAITQEVADLAQEKTGSTQEKTGLVQEKSSPAQETNQEQSLPENLLIGLEEDLQNPLKEQETDKTNEGAQSYDDEYLATENYYEEKENEREQPIQAIENAQAESGTEKQGEKAGANLTENANAQKLLHPFRTDGDGYYRSVKNEIDELFSAYPRDDTLLGAFCCSEWVRVKGEENNPQYLVGVIYDDGRAKYICYALAAEDENTPPDELRSVCSFVPATPYEGAKGFFVIFQSASTGECIKPHMA